MRAMLSGQKLRAIRALKGLTQAQLAEKSGVSSKAIAEFELGKRDLRSGTILKLCDAMGVKVTYHVDQTTISGP